MKKCPYCAEELQDKAIKCRYCGEWLDREKLKHIKNTNFMEKEEKMDTNEKKDDKEKEFNKIEAKKCPYCGLINPNTATLCDCGYRFNSEYIDSKEIKLILKDKLNKSIDKSNNSLRSKYRDETSPRTSYFYPAVRTESNFNNLFVLEIEGKKIRIERSTDGNIYVSKANEKILDIPKKISGKITEIEIADHKLSIQYKDVPSILGLLFWNSGFRIFVDSKPLENTSGDPRRRVKFASYAFFLFAAIALFNFFINPYPEERFLAIILLPVLIILGLLTKKTPILTTALGSLYGIFDVFFFIVQAIESSYATESMGWFLFWLLLRGGATLTLFQGVFAGVKLRSLKKSFVR